MASLVKKCRHGRSEWEQCRCQWYIRQRIAGRDDYTPAGSGRVTAERALAQLGRNEVETVSTALSKWLDAKAREPGARAGSLASYNTRAVHVRDGLGHNAVRSLRPIDLTNFVDGLLAEGFSPVYTKAIYNVLTATLRYAQRRGVISAMPLPPQGPGIPARLPRVHDLTLADVEGIIGRLTGTWKLVAELVFLTGLRWGEVMGLRPEDVGKGVLHVRRTANRYGGFNPPKTKSSTRVVPLSQRANQVLKGLTLPISGDYTASRLALIDAMGPLYRKHMGWHSLRGAHATLLDLAGVTLRDQAARMGHGTNYAQTLAYGISQAGSADSLDKARDSLLPIDDAGDGGGRDTKTSGKTPARHLRIVRE